MDTWLASRLSGKKGPTKADIAALADTVKAAIAAETLNECCDAVMAIYAKHGANANAAKGGDMVGSLLGQLNEMYP
jgi:hypothetical protein